MKRYLFACVLTCFLSVYGFTAETPFKLGDTSVIGVNPKTKGKSVSYESVRIVLSDDFNPNELVFEGLVVENKKAIKKGICNEYPEVGFSIGSCSCSLSALSLDENGIDGIMKMQLSYEFGNREILIPHFKVKANGKTRSGSTSESSFIRIAGWLGELKKVSVDNNVLKAESFDLMLYSIMGSEILSIPKVIIDLAKETVTTGKGTVKKEFLSVNGYKVQADGYEVKNGEVIVYGRIKLPQSFGEASYVEAKSGIPLDENGNVSLNFNNREMLVTLGGFDITILDGVFDSNGLSIGKGLLDLSGYGCKDKVKFGDLVFYPDGDIKKAVTVFEGFDFALKDSVFSLGVSELTITDLKAIGAKGFLSLPDSFGDQAIYFDTLSFNPNKTLTSGAAVRDFSMSLGCDTYFETVSLDSKGLVIGNLMITLPDYLEAKTLRARDCTILHSGKMESRGGIDPFELYGAILYIDKFSFNAKSFTGSGGLRIPSDFYITDLASVRFEVAQFAIDFTEKKASFLFAEKQAMNFAVPNGWKIAAKDIGMEKDALVVKDGNVSYGGTKEKKVSNMKISLAGNTIDFNDAELNSLYSKASK